MAPDGPATPDHGPAPASSHTLGRRLFCHGLGAVHLAASLSLLFQVRGLMGAGGIHPAAQFLHHAKTQLGPEAFWKIPSLCWFWHSDTALASLCLIQALAGSLLLLGRLPGPAALTGWTALLSLCSVGSPFLDFQWDALLLETTLLATFLLPWQLRPNWASESGIQRISLWLLWWLLFRLMLLSGIVKLSSGDPAWRGLSALCHHFETQPLPLWTAFHLHKLPAPVLQAATLAMFLIELVVPFGFFTARFRVHAALTTAALQTAILLTGNFAYFNWLTLTLCLLLLPDPFWARFFPAPASQKTTPTPSHPTQLAAFCAFALFATLITGLQTVARILPRSIQTPLVLSLSQLAAPLRSFNSYGLFAVMTTRRLEILVEGSNDGQTWRGYRFKWKVEDPRMAPQLVAPFQPRLDWQMWFAALGSLRDSPWFLQFLQKLLQGSPEVLALLAENPFPENPPLWVRARLFEYRFADTGPGWWLREERGLFCPPIRLAKPESTQASQGSTPAPEPR